MGTTRRIYGINCDAKDVIGSFTRMYRQNSDYFDRTTKRLATIV